MTARQAAVLALPGVVVLLAAVPFWLAAGPVHLLSAGVAVALCVPPAVGTFWLTRWLAGRHPLGGVIGMAVGLAARVVVAVGGGAAAYLVAPDLRETGISFWLWLLSAYLLALLAETALLSGASAAAGSGAGARG